MTNEKFRAEVEKQVKQIMHAAANRGLSKEETDNLLKMMGRRMRIRMEKALKKETP